MTSLIWTTLMRPVAPLEDSLHRGSEVILKLGASPADNDQRNTSKNCHRNPHSFTAFSSVAQDAARQQQEAVSPATQAERGQGGANASPSEITTLERRVLAHERILRALIVCLAEDDPDILVQLKTCFGSGHDLGEGQPTSVCPAWTAIQTVRPAIQPSAPQRQLRSFRASLVDPESRPRFS